MVRKSAGRSPPTVITSAGAPTLISNGFNAITKGIENLPHTKLKRSLVVTVLLLIFGTFWKPNTRGMPFGNRSFPPKKIFLLVGTNFSSLADDARTVTNEQ